MRIKSLVPLAALVVGLAVPAASLGQATHAGPSNQPSPTRLCKAQRDQLGVTLFKTTYGTNARKSNAFANCVSLLTKQERQNTTNANASCQTEQVADPQAFQNTYGANGHTSNAFGHCVSGHAKQLVHNEQQGPLNASRNCRAQRNEMGTIPFRDFYGTNTPNKKNAFGKCVSTLAKAQRSNLTVAAQTCLTAQAADPQGFAGTYGTNASKSNAFGTCVSQTAKQKTQAQQQATIKAARSCTTERKTLGVTAFDNKYGTNSNKTNAFKNCVITNAKGS